MAKKKRTKLLTGRAAEIHAQRTGREDELETRSIPLRKPKKVRRKEARERKAFGAPRRSKPYKRPPF